MNIFNHAAYFFTGGDWTVFFARTIKSLPWFPRVWYPSNGNGFGQNISFVLGYKTFFAIITKFCSDILHLPWNLTEQLIFFIPFWVFSALSSYFLSRYFIKNRISNLLSSLIYTTNTYALMLVGGGQMGVALAYAFSPFVLLSLLKMLEKARLKSLILSSLLLGLLLCIDPRIAGIILFIAFIFLLFNFSSKKFFYFFGSFILGFLLNTFWILPFLFSGTAGLSSEYTSSNILSFLSFATFENSISLLHPNWPENVFGLVHFMRWEFLILPVIAYSSLLFLEKQKDKILRLNIITLAFVGLIGAFLGKGVNLPFGSVYYFLSNHVPGFIIFRDPTKWYSMVAISYSLLIPITLYNLINFVFGIKQFKINSIKSKKVEVLVVVIFLFFWGITIHQLFLGQLTGTFKPKTIPQEYQKLENLLANQNDFSRTLWVPQQSRFGFFSNTHPAVDTYDLITSHELKPTFKYLNRDSTREFIQDSAIKYVIVPYDSTGEIFLKDRKYDAVTYKNFIENMDKIPWLSKIKSYKQIGVFKVKDYKSHAYIPQTGKKIPLKQISLTEYSGEVKLQTRSRLVFSEQYDPHWILKYGNKEIISSPYENKFDSFILPSGNLNFVIEYATQKWVDYGMIISAGTLVILAFGLVRYKK